MNGDDQDRTQRFGQQDPGQYPGSDDATRAYSQQQPQQPRPGQYPPQGGYPGQSGAQPPQQGQSGQQGPYVTREEQARHDLVQTQGQLDETRHELDEQAASTKQWRTIGVIGLFAAVVLGIGLIWSLLAGGGGDGEQRTVSPPAAPGEPATETITVTETATETSTATETTKVTETETSTATETATETLTITTAVPPADD